MSSLLKTIVAPITSLIILVMGNGLLMTIVPLQLKLFGYSTELAGYVSAAYFAGLMLGSLYTSKIIEGVGHIRSFAAFASFLTFLVMLQGFFIEPIFWIIMRCLTGICMGGLFITIESWLLVKSSVQMRGRVLSVYMIAFYAAQSLGQFLLNLSDPKSIIPFCIIVAFTSLSVVPVSISKNRAPIIEEPSILNPLKLFKLSPLGVIGCIFSGFILGSIYGLLPIYAQDLKLEISQIAKIMGITIFGGLILQWPIGTLSDKIDRRKILLILSILTVIMSLLLAIFSYENLILLYLLCWVFGGISFTLYPLSISHACDVIHTKDLVAATGGLLLSYGVGSIIGPILAPFPMKVLGPGGLFYFNAGIASILAIFTLFRIQARVPVAQEEKLPYSNMPRTTPMASELDPRSEEIKTDENASSQDNS